MAIASGKSVLENGRWRQSRPPSARSREAALKKFKNVPELGLKRADGDDPRLWPVPSGCGGRNAVLGRRAAPGGEASRGLAARFGGAARGTDLEGCPDRGGMVWNRGRGEQSQSPN